MSAGASQMSAGANPISKRLLLVGAGHAHAQVLKGWAASPLPGVELVVVSPHALAPYSGMVPGWLAGTYDFDDIVIDFSSLCERAGARWVPAELLRLDPRHRHVELSNGERLRYDLLSLNVGSTLTPPTGDFSARVLPMRPLAELRERYGLLIAQWRDDDRDQPFRITAVGGGAAGFESLLAVLRRLRDLRPGRRVEGTLLTRSLDVLPGHPAAAQRAAMRALREANVSLQAGSDWSDEAGQGADLVLWATGAQAHAWQRDPQRRGELAVSPDGFVQVDETLRSVSHPNVLAAGDCAQWLRPLPKAGVFAVRMGPVLLHNLQATLAGEPLRPYEPQTAFLTLLATADGRAIASRGAWSLSGRWAWRLKDRIDRGFIRRFSSQAVS